MQQNILQIINGIITLQDDTASYTDTIDNFKTDGGANISFSYIIYNKTLKLLVIDNTLQDYTDREDLDAIISQADIYATNQHKRLYPVIETKVVSTNV